jgi:rhamnosyltransferase
MQSSSYQSFIDSILIILVFYKSNLEKSESFQSLEACFGATNTNADIFIYDNSPQQLDPIPNCSSCKIYYVWNSNNPGVGKAYNEGFRYGKNKGKKWLLLLDQDTSFESNFLIKYYDTHTSCPSASLLAPILRLESGDIYSPCTYRFPRTFILKEVNPGIVSIENLSLLNSGILIKIDIFQATGGYDERLRMDFTDFEFVDRYRKIKNDFAVVDTVGIHGFSGFQDKINASFSRFDGYCQSVVILCLIYPKPLDRIQLITFALLRSVKLSLRFRRIGFLNTFLKTLFSFGGNNIRSN